MDNYILSILDMCQELDKEQLESLIGMIENLIEEVD